MKQITEWFQTTIGLSPDVQAKLLTSIIIILVLWILRVILIRIVWREAKDPVTRYTWQKSSSYIAFFIGILLVGRVWFKGFQSLATYLGLVSAGLAIALKDIIANLAGWIFIIWRRPFVIGDRIQIGEHAGDVVDIRVFQFSLMEIQNWVDADQSTGRLIHIPNSMVLTQTQANYSKGFQYIWNEIPVLVTFESNWHKAKDILQKIISEHADKFSKGAEKEIREASKKFLLSYPSLNPLVYTNVKDSGILLTIRYLCELNQRRDSTQTIWENILQEFAKCSDIDLAYPTRRFYNNLLEGKSDTKPHGDKE
jgi:small-conductance mechanosensitive channel